MPEQPGVFQRGIVEFVVIVIGVLVALGLESWWQGRQDAALAEEYLESLKTEARAGAATVENVASVTGLKSYWLARASSIHEAGLAADSPAVFLEGVLQGSGIVVVPQLSDAVFQDLQSTGRLRLFADGETRRHIIRGYANVEAMLVRQERGMRNIDSRLHALASRYAPPGAVRVNGPRITIDTDLASTAELRRAAVSLAADPAFPGELRAASRALDQERNILDNLFLILENQLTVLEGGELPEGAPFRELMEAQQAVEAAEAERQGAGDSVPPPR